MRKSPFFLVLLSSLLFFISHPNVIFKEGMGFLGFFIYLPAFLSINKLTLKNAWLYGGLFGFTSYFLFAFWLTKYHFITLILVTLLYFLFCALMFEALKLSDYLFSGCLKPLIFTLTVCLYEYLKSLGFLGFSYGITAYTQWHFIHFIQIANLGGVFLLDLAIIFPSALLSEIIRDEKKLGLKASLTLKKNFVFLIAYSFLFFAIIFYGKIQIDKNYLKEKNNKTLGVLAVQNNESPWKNGLEEHNKNLSNLIEITDSALKSHPAAAFVIWPETAIAPSIIHHFYSMEDPERLNFVVKLLNYIDSKTQVFVIGNAHEEYDKNHQKKIFNNSFVFDAKNNVFPPEPEAYTKMHLVPFSESFPYKKLFPQLYKKLLKSNTHFWEQGKDYTVFHKRSLSFSTPICFEDTFGSECRFFVIKGARCFFNLSNDSWSQSLACQNQHLSMAVFRSVENKIPTVRASSSGQTCMIDSCGRVKECAKPFTRAYVYAEIPVIENFSSSFYTKYGDWVAKALTIVYLLLLISKAILCIIKYILKKQNFSRKSVKSGA